MAKTEGGKAAIDSARVLEKAGRHEQALQLLVHAGEIEEAARVLSSLRRFSEAADLLARNLGVALEDAGQLGTDGRRLAMMAGVCFARAGRTVEAVNLFMAIKEPHRAIEVLEKAGDALGASKLRAQVDRRLGQETARGPKGPLSTVDGPVTSDGGMRLEKQGKLADAMQVYAQLRKFADAGRVARDLGRYDQAAGFYGEAGMPYEQAQASIDGGDSAGAMDAFCRVPRADARYRTACSEAIRLALDLNRVGMKLDNFLTNFVASGPQIQKEFESFYMLAKLYEQHGMFENAKECFEKILDRMPKYRDAAQQLERLDQLTRPSAEQIGAVLKEEASFQGGGQRRVRKEDMPLPDLPELPGLPSLPAMESAGVPLGATAPPMTRERAFGGIPPQQEVASGTFISQSRLGGAAAGPAPIRLVAPANPVWMEPDAVINGRYHVHKVIGRGGMAVVLKATDMELGEDIALKVFTQSVDDEAAVTRFKQELQLSRQLAHPNILRLYDIGQVDGNRFISMELLSGHSLKDEIKSTPSLKRAVSLMLQACAGMDAVHNAGIVHRDVKPDNMFVTEQGVLKVMDFGIAKRVAAAGVTVMGTVAGTPAYMSPEQINDFSKVGRSADLYSLGVMLFELTTGRVPFISEELMTLVMKHINEMPPAPRTINPAIPVSLEQIILRLLEKKPEARYKDCRELAAVLRPTLDAL